MLAGSTLTCNQQRLCNYLSAPTLLMSDNDNNHSERNAAAVMLGRLGGKKGGPARAAKLSRKQRREIAIKAARARWDKKRRKVKEAIACQD